MISQAILRAFDSKTYDAIQSYRVKDDALMPWVYQNSRRSTHDDWAIMKNVKRIDTAYRVPLPFKQISGKSEKRWVLWDEKYPTSPDLQMEMRGIWDGEKNQWMLHALIDCAVEEGGWAEFAAFINGKWVPVFKQYRAIVLGRRLAYYGGGLKQDTTVTPQKDGSIRSDLMGWWDPPTCSWNKVSQ